MAGYHLDRLHILYLYKYIHTGTEKQRESKLAIMYWYNIDDLPSKENSSLRKISTASYTGLVGLRFLIKRCNWGNKPESETEFYPTIKLLKIWRSLLSFLA